jgi:XTP/dITP diphosphohydrolase
MTGPRRVVVATGNPGKLREFQDLLGNAWDLVAQADLEIASIPETGNSFEANALLKARHAAAASGLPAIADDSGLEVDALDGAPGIYSARYAGEQGDDEANNEKLLSALAGLPLPQRIARYRCVIVYARGPDDPDPVVVSGDWEGRIALARRGTGGFGYDPLFIDPESGRHAAELTPAEKHARSHRGQAIRALRERLGTLR